MCGLVLLSKPSITKEQVDRSLGRIFHRGPDSVVLSSSDSYWMGFNRLSIMDQSHDGNQPFRYKNTSYMCNGEIYNFLDLKDEYTKFDYKSSSDCEVLIPIFENGGVQSVVEKIDGEYSFVIHNDEGNVWAARDPMGIRPLFYGYCKESGMICFASEAKCLVEVCKGIKPFPPGHFYQNGEFISFCDLSVVKSFHNHSMQETLENINQLLVDGVVKRLNADAEVGYLLSGGLDSSLVCSIAQKHSKEPIKTFGIGMSEDAIDLKYAKEVADFIGSDHTEVIITKDDVIKSINEVIKSLETWDITTIRASLGMYLVCKYIQEKTNVKVLMTGEVSDEIFGYKYTDFAPSAFEFQKEAAKRVEELYIYDVLRADRCISAHSLEARVPFSDTPFVEYVMGINPTLKMNSYGQGKYLLRKAFEGEYLPESILYREKAAFSDAVGHSLVDCIKEYAENLYSDQELKSKCNKYEHGTPFTKESLMYREIFESFYAGQGKLIKDFWMPNKEWDNCDVVDPSARVLPNYGLSGS